MELKTTAGSSGSTSASANATPLLVSFRELCHSLEAFNPTISKTSLQKQLKDALPAFKACGEALPGLLVSGKTKATSEGVTLNSGKTVRCEDQQKELHKAISQLHKIEEGDVAVMLRIFFDSDDSNLELLSTSSEAFRSPLQQKSSNRRKRGPMGIAKIAEDITTKFFDAFTAFYFEEKLYILRCISALIRIADDSFHDLNDVAKEVLSEFADQSFALKCLSRFQHLCQQELVEDIRDVPRYSIFWSKHGLREQLALLEVVFLLYYSRLDSTAVLVKSIINVVRETDFGKSQASSGFFDSEAGQLVDCIGSFLMILSVESLELEKCMEELELHSTTREVPKDAQERNLIDSPEVLGEIIGFLQTTTQADALRAPLLVSLALLLSRIDSALSEWQSARPTEPFPPHLEALRTSLLKRGGVGALWPDFVSAALTPDLDLFGTLNAILLSPLFRTDAPISAIFSLATSSSLALRAVFKGLLLSITQLIRPEYISDYSGLINLWKNTFSSQDPEATRSIQGGSDSIAALCAQFWEVDFESEERRAVLNMATRRFPVSFSPLLRLCQALSGESNVPDDRSMRAGTAVLSYLAQITTLAQVMPSSPSFSLPYEPIESSLPDSGILYKATRDIPVFGKHLMIPSGTMGRIVSQPDQVPIVMVWEMEGSGYSAWRLLRDVLASFIGLLDTSSPWKAPTRPELDGSDSDVFHEKDPVANFATLAPEEGVQFDGEVAADAMNLISSVLSGGRYLSATLLNHLNGDDIGVVEVSQPTAASPKPTLVEVAIRILDQSLKGPAVALRVILASFRLLTLLVPSSSASLWQAMRSSNALTGASGIVPFTSQGNRFQTSSVSLLSHEVASGQFSGLLSMLDFHLALLLNLQKTQYSSSMESLQVKVEVVGRAAHFIINQVWSEFQNWKYISIREQTEIGRKCITFFNCVYSDDSFNASPLTKKLVDLVDSCFLSPAAPIIFFAPLLRTLANGQRFIDTLQREMRQVEGELARKNLICSLQFSLAIIQRQEIKDPSLTSLKGFESMLFDRNSKGHGDPVKAIARLTLMPHSQVINMEAVKLMTALSRSTTRIQSSLAPTLVGHLGSLYEVEWLANGLLSLVDNSGQDNALLVQTWNLLSAIVDSQPALATLLLTGKHLAASVEKQLATFEGENKTATAESIPIKSAIDIAKNTVMSWKDILTAQSIQGIALLEGALKFLNVAWKHALEHRDAFLSIRADANFWSNVSQLAQAQAESPPTLPPTTMTESTDGSSKSDACDAVCQFALTRMCAARALELLTLDVKVTPLLLDERKKAGSATDRLSYEQIVAIISKPPILTSALQAALSFPCDTLMHEDVISRLNQTFPEMSMDDFRIPARRDDYDYTRPFGDKYVYDIDQLQTKLQGFAPSVEEELEGDEVQSAALQQAILLMVGLNLDWSIIDAQGNYLAAWTTLLTAMMGPLMDETLTNKQVLKKTQESALAAWIESAKVTAGEDVESEVTTGIHTQRISLLNILLKLGWTNPQQGSKIHQLPENNDSDEQVRDAMEQIEQIVTHPLFRVEDALRNRATFPRQVFEMVYLCAKRYVQLREKLEAKKGSAKSKGALELFRAAQQSAESFTLITITCLRIITDHSWGVLTTHQGDREGLIIEAEEDLALLTSIVDILISPDGDISPHVWAPRFQTTSVLSAAVDLFSRSPMQPQIQSQSADELLASGVTPIYSTSLLTFFFHLASHRNSAELLVMAGIMNGLCSNALSSVMDSSEEGVPPRLANTSYENPTHSCWVQMLRIVVALIAELDGPQSQRFIRTEAWSFFKVYERKMNSCLQVRIRAKAGLMMTTMRRGESVLGDTIRVNQLEEVDLVHQLYLHVVRAKVDQLQQQPAEKGEDTSLPFASYIDRASLQLQEFVHLLQHPRELTALVGEEKEKKEEERVKLLLTSTCSSIVAAFWEIERGGQVLCMEPNDWDLHRMIITPTIGTTPTSPASTGTLLDFATYLVEAIMRLRTSSSQQQKENMTYFLSVLEQTASLCTTQLVLAAYARPNNYSTTIRKDLETGLGRDVKQGLESARGAMQAAGETTFLDVILAFHNRWLHGSD